MNELNIDQNPQNVSKSGDEVDIFELASRMWKAFMNFLSNIKNLFLFMLILLIRKLLWIASFAVVGIAAGVIYGLSVQPFRVSSLLEGSSGGVDNTVVIDRINNLDLMVDRPEELAKYLNLEIEEAYKVHYIKAFYGIDINSDGHPDYIDENLIYDPADTTQLRLPSLFYVRVALYDEAVLPKLRESLLQYINGDAYIQTLFAIDRRQKAEMIDILTKEIAKLDTIHLFVQNQRTKLELGDKVFIVGNEPEIKLFYTDVLNLYSQKQSLQKNLEISDRPVIVVQDFSPSLFEDGASSYYTFCLALAMAFIGFVCSLLWQYRKTLWKLITEDKE